MTYDVITIGSATRDVFVKSVAFEVHDDANSETGIEGCFPLGVKIELDDVVFETGGGATNAAATFSRLGFSTAIVCSIGDDPGGRDVVEALEVDKISTTLIQRHHEFQTGISIIMVAGTGERTVLVYRGASKRIETDAINWKALKARWFYMSSLGGELDFADHILSHAATNGISVAWNPGGKEIATGFDAMAPLINKVDVFNLNREEASQLAGIDGDDLKGIFAKLSPLPRRNLVITDGLGGTYVSTPEGILHSDVMEVPRVNTTGAGDAFGSGFVSGLIKKDDVRYALAVGTWNATGVVQEMGAKRGLIRSFPADYSTEQVTIRPWN